MTTRILAWLLPVVVPSALVVASACAVTQRDFGTGGAGASSSDGGSGGFGGFGGDGAGGFGGAFTVGSGEPGFCDNTGVCGIFSGNNGCAECAAAGQCFGAFEFCFNGSNFSCEDFVDCLRFCVNSSDPQGCGADCQMQNPEGASSYEGLATCLYCNACPIDCKNEAQFDPAAPGCF
jgi:hypothetical protein